MDDFIEEIWDYVKEMNFRRHFEDTVVVSSTIGHLVTPLVYPPQSVKCVMTDHGHVMTRNALILLENLDIEHPVGQYVYEVCLGFMDQYKTGGAYLLYFIASWTKAAHLLCNMGIPSSVVTSLLGTVIDSCIEHTDTLKGRVIDVIGQPDSNVDIDSLSDTSIRLNEVESHNELPKGNEENIEEVAKHHIPYESRKCLIDKSQSENEIEIDKTTSSKHGQCVDRYVTTSCDITSVQNSECRNKWLQEHKNIPMKEHDNIPMKEHDNIPMKEHDNIPKKGTMSDNTEDEDKFIDGIKVVQLKMKNAIDVSQMNEFNGDISWFFHADCKMVPRDNETHKVASTYELSNEKESKGHSENVTKFTVDETDLVKEVTEDRHEKKRIYTDLSREMFDRASSAVVINQEYDNTADTMSDLNDELSALKACIDMDIKRIKQRQKQLKKGTKCKEDEPDPHFDDCFEEAEDEFDSCFDNSVPMVILNRGTVDCVNDSNTENDGFKTVQFSFINEKQITNNKDNETSLSACQRQHTEFETEQQNNIQDDDGSEIIATCQSSMNDERKESYQDFFEKTNGDNEKLMSDKYLDDFETAFHDFRDKSELTSKNIKCTTSGEQTSLKISKTTTGVKLQELDGILNSLGKNLKQSTLNTNRVRISSRHLTELNSTGNINVDGLDSADTNKPSVEKPNTFESKSRHVDIIEETNVSLTEKNQLIQTERRVPQELSCTSSENSGAKALSLKNMNELLNNLSSVKGPLTNIKKKPTFQSGIQLRSRHLVNDKDDEEPGDHSRLQMNLQDSVRTGEADIRPQIPHLVNSLIRADAALSRSDVADVRPKVLQMNLKDSVRSGEADIRPKIMQLVSNLSHGTDYRLVNIVTDIVVKHSAGQTTCSIMPQYVQTYGISGGQADPALVDGIVIQTSQSQAEMVNGLHGRPCRLLIVNADITLSYKHKGYKPMKSNRILTSETFADHVTKRDQWTSDVVDILNKLKLDMVLARGSISEDFRDICNANGVLAMAFVPYKQLSLISEAARIAMVSYITLATLDNVCQHVFVSPWQQEVDLERTFCTGSCHHAVVVSITTNNPQTVVLRNHVQSLVDLEEEEFWECLHRTASALQAGFLLPGAGKSELACASFCTEMREKLLKESCHQLEGENTINLITMYEIIAQTFREHARLVQEHFAFIVDRETDCVFDDYRTKVSGWRTALDTVCTVLSSDIFIVTGIKEEQQLPSDFVVL